MQGGKSVPFYPYHCRACGETTDIFARTVNENIDSKLSCAHCGSPDIDRRLAPPFLPADEKASLEMLRRRAEAEGHGAPNVSSTYNA